MGWHRDDPATALAGAARGMRGAVAPLERAVQTLKRIRGEDLAEVAMGAPEAIRQTTWALQQLESQASACANAAREARKLLEEVKALAG